MKPFIILSWVLALSCFIYQPLASQESDIGRKEEHVFQVQYNGQYFSLLSQAVIEQTYRSKRSTEWNTFYIYESFFDKITSISGEYDDDEIDESAISSVAAESEDVFILDSRIHKISFPTEIDTGKSGYYEYQKEYKDIAYFPVMFIPNLNKVDEYSIVVKHPSGVKINFDIIFTIKDVPYTIDTTSDKETILKFSSIKYSDHLPYYPFNRFHAAVLTSVQYQGNINPVTPADFSQWYFNLLDSSVYSADFNTPDLHSAITAAPTNRGKIKLIYDYVRKNIRYIAEEQGLNAIVPRDPTTVFTRKYGDCKDKAFLVSAIAKKYGITVYPVLVSTNPKLPFKAVHPTLFNHVICLYEEGNERIYTRNKVVCEKGMMGLR